MVEIKVVAGPGSHGAQWGLSPVSSQLLAGRAVLGVPGPVEASLHLSVHCHVGLPHVCVQISLIQ